MANQNSSLCYFPSKRLAEDHTPCNAGAAASACCYKDDICLSNGYCLQTQYPWSNRLGRHSCTDKDWGPSCASHCRDTRPDNSIGLYLVKDQPGGAFCCSSNINGSTGLCQVANDNSYTPFDLSDGFVIWNRTNGATISSGTVTLADLKLPSSNTIASPTPSSSCNTTMSESTADSSSNIVPVAVGIAVPLAVLLLAALAACAVMFSQNRKLRKERALWSAQHTIAEPHFATQRIMSPAPQYEYKHQSSTNWAPVTPQRQAFEVSGGPELQPNELAANEARKPHVNGL